MTTQNYYLITYDRRTRKPEVREFTSAQREQASAAYDQQERVLSSDETKDVVLLRADSLETLRKTHPNYFGEEPTHNALRLGA